MSTYYEVIEVSPSAGKAEIEQALDKQYNQFRRLVTHHDPNVVSQATRALQLLEMVRATLMDADKRALYDAEIGVTGGEKFGGLAEPFSAKAPAPEPFGMLFGSKSFPRSVSPPPAPAVRPISQEPQGWVCPKCKMANAVNSLFCKSCGEMLASPCPACGSLVVKGAQFCSKCGISIEQGLRKKEIEGLLGQLRINLNEAVRSVPVPEANIKDLGRLVVRDACWALVSLMVGLISWQTVSGSLFGISLAGLLPLGNGGFGDKMGGALLLVAAVAILAGMFVLLSIIHRVFPLVTAIGAGLAMILLMTLPATFLELLGKLGAPIIGSYIAAWIVTVLVFPLLISRIFAATQHSVESLKPFYKWIPNLGFMDFLLWMVFCMLPILYAAYAFLAAARLEELLSRVMNEYEGLLLLVNGMLFFFSALLLVIYTLLVWRTSRSVETRFKQAVAERADKIVKLDEQIKSLEQGLASINLRSR